MSAFVRYVLLIEAVFINIGAGLICLFIPGWFTSNFTTETMPLFGLELARWYGVLLVFLGYVVLRMFAARNLPGMAVVVETLLVGDVLHFLAALNYLRVLGVVNLAVGFMFFMTVFLASVRLTWLIPVFRRQYSMHQESR
jgi:hypothetical protein